MKEAERNDICQVIEAVVGYAGARNVYYKKTGRMLSSKDIACIAGLNRKALKMRDKPCKNVMEYLNTKGFDFVAMIHRDPVHKETHGPRISPDEAVLGAAQSGMTPTQSGVTHA